ncbi:MAG: hypothetical protein ACJ76T_00430 [Solirubrobacteraceae bacterium]
MGRWTRRGRSTLSTVLTVVAMVFVLVGGATLYLREEVFDAGAFAHRATASLQKSDIRGTISDIVVATAIEKGTTELIQAKPLLQTVVNGALGTPAFGSIFRHAALNLHKAAFTRDDRSVALDLADAGQVAISAANAIAPQLAKKIPKDLNARLIDFRKRQWATTTLEVGDNARWIGIVGPLVALLLIAGAIAVAPNRRTGIARVGIALTVIAVIGFAALLYLHDGIVLTLQGGDSARATRAGQELFDVYFGDLRTWCLAVGGFGLVLAAAATSVLQPVEIATRAERARALALHTPTTPAGRLGRGALIFAVGLFVVLDPGEFLTIVAIVAGAFGLFFGTSEILAVVTRPRARTVREAAGQSRRAIAITAALVLLVAAGAVATALALQPSPTKRPRFGADPNPAYCNGFRELCNRNLDRVAFASSHNSMSAGDYPGFYFAHHTGTIGAQLDYGIRGLLIDAYYGIRDPQSNRVRTDLNGPARAKVSKLVGPQGIEAAKRLAGRIGLGGLKGRKGLYLCHALCELGAVPMSAALDEVRTFMAKHPDEVLVIFVEDYVPAAAIAKAFKDAGLLPYVLDHARDRPWPTLRQMVTSGRRLLVMAEEHADLPKVPWYDDGFDDAQDTPYSFKTVDQLRDYRRSCALLRGNPNSPLFLINHWIEKLNPSPAQSADINGFRFLLRRVKTCARMRGLFPTLVAVNFYDRGDVLGVVNVLNGLPPDAKAQLPARKGS